MNPGAPDRDASCHRDLVSEAQNGDSEALTRLYESSARKVHGYIHALVGADHADDVAADTWVRILQGLPGYRPELGDFHGWATVIARNQALDHLRRLRRNRSVPVAPDELPHAAAPDDTERQALKRIATAEIVTVVSSLPRDQARVVLLCVIIGMDARTAGRLLDKKPGAVRTARHRGLKLIKIRLQAVPVL